VGNLLSVVFIIPARRELQIIFIGIFNMCIE